MNSLAIDSIYMSFAENRAILFVFEWSFGHWICVSICDFRIHGGASATFSICASPATFILSHIWHGFLFILVPINGRIIKELWSKFSSWTHFEMGRDGFRGLRGWIVLSVLRNKKIFNFWDINTSIVWFHNGNLLRRHSLWYTNIKTSVIRRRFIGTDLWTDFLVAVWPGKSPRFLQDSDKTERLQIFCMCGCLHYVQWNSRYQGMAAYNWGTNGEIRQWRVWNRILARQKLISETRINIEPQ